MNSAFRSSNIFDQINAAHLGTKSDVQIQAWKRFVERGLPTTRHEDWKYTSLRGIESFDVPQMDQTATIDDVLPVTKNATAKLVLENGVLRDAHQAGLAAEQGFRWTRLATNTAEYSTLCEALAKSHTDHSLVDAALALPTAAYRLEVSASDQRIEIMHRMSTVAKQAVHVLIDCRIASGCSAELVHQICGGGAKSLYHVAMVVDQKAHASLSQVVFQDLSTESFLFWTSDFRLAERASLKLLNVDTGAKIARHNLSVNLLEQESSATLDAVYLNDQERIIDHHTAVKHCVPQTRSQQLYKGIVAGSSRFVFNGKVVVAPGASGTDAAQLNKSLLIGDHAEVDTKPELQIDHNDVRCSHGATIGRLNKDQLFYLTSRGISPANAARLLASAYIEDVLHAYRELIDIDKIQPYLARTVSVDGADEASDASLS